MAKYVFTLSVHFDNKEQLLKSLRATRNDVDHSLQDGVVEGCRVFSLIKDCSCEYDITEDSSEFVDGVYATYTQKKEKEKYNG